MNIAEALVVIVPIACIGIMGSLRIYTDHKEAMYQLLLEHKEALQRIELASEPTTE